MKRQCLSMLTVVGVLFCGSVLFAQTQTQPSGIAPVISYQGLITTDKGAHLPTGDYSVGVRLYADEGGKETVWQGIYKVRVENGIFNLYLGSGEFPLPSSLTLDRPLWVGVRFGDDEEMAPRTPLTASPYALNIPDNSVTEKKIAADYVSSIRINGEKITSKGGSLNMTAGEGIALRYDHASQSMKIDLDQSSADGKKGATTQAAVSSVHWSERGNSGTTAGTDFLGTTDISAFEIHVDDNNTSTTSGVKRVMLYAPNATSANLIGGFNTNSFSTNVVGATIGGGGQSGGPNSITGDFGSILGGRTNIAGADASVGGGQSNTASGAHSRVGGGQSNTASGAHSGVGGGQSNTASGAHSTVSGGSSNSASAAFSSVVGGQSNAATGTGATVGGGQTNSAGATNATVGGGNINNASAPQSTVSGGDFNYVADDWGTIGGGTYNFAGRSMNLTSEYATVGGGRINYATGLESTIGGGHDNVAEGDRSTVGGGYMNLVYGHRGTIAGGEDNRVGVQSVLPPTYPPNPLTPPLPPTLSSVAQFSTIGGGSMNVAASGAHATIAGGNQNQANGSFAAIGGGTSNVASGSQSAIAGGSANTSAASSAAIGGGSSNLVQSTASLGTIGGGSGNTIDDDTHGVIAGGLNNQAGSVDGFNNDQAASVGGGEGNWAFGAASAIPGGRFLKVGPNSFGFSGDAAATALTRTDISGHSGAALFNNVNLWIGNVDGAARELRLFEPNSGPVDLTYSSLNFTGFKAQAMTANAIYTMPSGFPGTAGSILTSNTSGLLAWTATLPIANGGTNSSTALNNNRIMVSSGGAIVEATALANGQLFIGSTGAAPVAAALTAGAGIGITNGAGSITISALNSVGGGTTVNSTLRWDGSNWVENTNVTATSAGNLSAAGTVTAAGLVTAGAGVNLNGTTSPLQANGSAGTAGAVLTSAGAGATPQWTTVLPVANGGTNSSTTLNNNRIMVSSGGAIAEATALTNGQLLIGSTGAAPAPAALSAGTGISITNGAGSITISSTVTGALPTGTTTNSTLRWDGSNWVENSNVTATSAGVITSTGLNLTGTTSPLQVNGSAGTSGYVLTSQGGGATPQWLPAGGGSDWTLSGNSITSAWNGSSGSFIGTTNTQPLVIATTNTTTGQPIEFWTKNSKAVTIASDGAVGIAVATPLASLDLGGGLIIRPPSEFTIVGDNTQIDVTNRSFVQIGSDGAPTNRTITLTGGMTGGQIVIIHCTASGTDGIELRNAGTASLPAHRVLVRNDSLILIWDAIVNKWVEIGRTKY